MTQRTVVFTVCHATGADPGEARDLGAVQRSGFRVDRSVASVLTPVASGRLVVDGDGYLLVPALSASLTR
jgi:hypothetical protein